MDNKVVSFEDNTMYAINSLFDNTIKNMQDMSKLASIVSDSSKRQSRTNLMHSIAIAGILAYLAFSDSRKKGE